MAASTVHYRRTRDIPMGQIVSLYKANHWSAAAKPVQLRKALLNSHSLVSAWDRNRLIALANAITDGHLFVYYSHLLVHPNYQRRGIGTRLMAMLMAQDEAL